MATKKQKREAALARRETYLEEIRQSGLAALERDRQAQAAESARIQQEVNRRHANILRKALPEMVYGEYVPGGLTTHDMLRLLIIRDLEQWTAPKSM